MAGINQYYPWAYGAGANVLSPSVLAALSSRTLGLTAGIVPSGLYNVLYRQPTVITSALAQAVCDNTTFNMYDDGSVANAEAGIVALIQSVAQGQSRTKITDGSALNFYANAATGSDSNSGLSSGSPKATLQACYNAIQDNYDLSGGSGVINAVGTFTAGLVANGPVLAGTISILGSTTVGATVIAPASGDAIQANVGSNVGLSNVTIEASSGRGVASGYGSIVTLGSGLLFGNCSGAHISVAAGGLVNIAENYAIAGSAAQHWLASNLGIISISGAITIAISGTLTFSQFAEATGGAQIVLSSGVSYTGTSPTNSVNKYLITTGAFLATAGAGVPGSGTGVSTTGYYS